MTEPWETRVVEPLVFHYHGESYAEQNLEAIVAAYQKALADVGRFLGTAEGSLPRIHVYLSQFAAGGNGRADGAVREGELESWTTINTESPDINAEQELTGLLLDKVYGPPSGSARFWYDGLAGHLAAEGGSAYHVEATQRVNRLLEAGQLPPLVDLLAIYGTRQSGIGVSAATAFVGFLIKRYGAERFKRLLGTLQASPRGGEIQRVYGVPLQSLEQAWYQELETAATAETSDMRQAAQALVPYMKLYTGSLFGIFICILVALSFAVFMPQAIRFLVNNILGRAPLPFPVPGVGAGGERIAGPDEQVHALWMLLGAMIFMFILSAVANARRSYLVTSMGEGVAYDLRMRLYNHLHASPPSSEQPRTVPLRRSALPR
jgi:hypothetical protein